MTLLFLSVKVKSCKSLKIWKETAAGSDTMHPRTVPLIPATPSAWQFAPASFTGGVLLTASQKLRHFAIAHRLVLSVSSHLFPLITL